MILLSLAKGYSRYMTSGSDEQIENIEAALLIGDSFKELSLNHVFLIRSSLNQFYWDLYRRKSRSCNNHIIQKSNRKMKKVIELEDVLRVLHRGLLNRKEKIDQIDQDLKEETEN